MPVYLDGKTLRMWLDSKKYRFEECEDIIEKLDVWKQTEAYEVSDLVSSIRNDSQELILPRKV